MSAPVDQPALFALAPWWDEYWQGMPEFVNEDREPVQKITVSFASHEDARRFGELIGATVSTATDSLWYPRQEWTAPSTWVYSDEP